MALPAGRRKAANVTLLTSLVEGEREGERERERESWLAVNNADSRIFRDVKTNTSFFFSLWPDGNCNAVQARTVSGVVKGRNKNDNKKKMGSEGRKKKWRKGLICY